MAGRVGIAEPDSLLGQLVHMWRLVKRAAVAPQVPPTKIVHQKKDNVRRRWISLSHGPFRWNDRLAGGEQCQADDRCNAATQQRKTGRPI